MPKLPRRIGAAPVLVDSCAWIALIRARDGRHADAERLFQHAVRERVPLLTTNLILAEVQRFVMFEAGPRAGAFVLQRIEASARVSIEFANRAQHARALEWLAKLGDQKITYADAVSFAVMEERGCAAVMSFDADFTLAGFTLWSGRG